jgi:hypothetical protein
LCDGICVVRKPVKGEDRIIKLKKQGFGEIFGIVSKLLDCTDCNTNLHNLTWKWSVMVNADIIKKSLERVM